MSEARDLTVPSASLFPSAQELATLKEMAQTFISSGLIPKAIDKPEKAIVVMLKGKEAGIPPLQALAHIHVIDGKPGMSAELMLSQLLKHIPGFMHQFLETSNTACRMRVKRPGGDWQEFAFTMQDAIAAGLAGKGPWRAYPAAMLRARCIAGMARAIGPEALAGISYTPEELGADVDSGGQVIGEGGGSTETAAEKVARLAALAKKPEPKEVIVEVAPPVAHAPKPEPQQTVAAPSEPDWGADLPSVVSAPALDPLGDYKIKTESPYQGKTLRELPRNGLAVFKTKLTEFAQKTGKPMEGKALQDWSRIDEFLRTTDPLELEPEPGSTG